MIGPCRCARRSAPLLFTNPEVRFSRQIIKKINNFMKVFKLGWHINIMRNYKQRHTN